MALSERWKLSVTSEERIDKIVGIAELAYVDQPLDEVVRKAREIESKVFETSDSKEKYMTMMDKLISNINKTIEENSRSQLEQMAAETIRNALEKGIKQINEEPGKICREKIKEMLLREEQILKDLWENYVKEHLEQTRRQQKEHAERLRLTVQGMELQKYAVNYRQQQQQQQKKLPSSSAESSTSMIETRVEPNSSASTSSTSSFTSSMTEFSVLSLPSSSSNSFSLDYTTKSES